MSKVVVVVAGGDRPGPAVFAALPEPDAIVCADSGIDYALERGWEIDVCVGDFDSVSPEGLKRAEAAGTEIQRHPENKDKTDLELSLLAAVTMAPTKIYVVGIGGGRLDHAFGNLITLTNTAFAHIELTALIGTAAVTVVHTTREITGQPAEVVSVFAVGGDAHGVCLEGMQYPLKNETLAGETSRGLSNKLNGRTASIKVKTGVLLVIQPEKLSPGNQAID